MTTRECTVGHLNLVLYEKRDRAAQLPMQPMAAIFEAKQRFVGADIKRVEPRWALNIIDAHVDKKREVITLLFFAIDKIRAPSALVDIDTLVITDIKKALNQGIALSAHMVIKYSPSPSGFYSALLEDTEGLSRSVVIPLLRDIINKYGSYFKNLENGKQEEVTVGLLAHPVAGAPLNDQLNKARLISVDLIAKGSGSSADMPDTFTVQRRIMQCRPKALSRGEAAKQVLRDIFASPAAEEYPDFRIHIADDEDAHHTVRGDHSKRDALMAAFQLRTPIQGLAITPSDATDMILPDVKEKMVALLLKT